MRYCLGLLICSLAASVTLAGSNDKLSKKIAPLLDKQAYAFVHVDLSKISAERIMGIINDMVKVPKKETKNTQAELNERLTALKEAGAKEFFVVFSLSDFPTLPPLFVAIPSTNNAEAFNIAGVIRKYAGPDDQVKIVKGMVVLAHPNVQKRLSKVKGAEIPNLDEAFAAAKGSAVRAVVVIPPYLRKSITELVPQLPPQLGGYKTAELLEDFHWLAGGVHLDKQLSVKMVLQSSSAKSSKQLRNVLVAVMENIRKEAKRDEKLYAHLKDVIKVLTPKLAMDQLVLELNQKEIVRAIAPMIVKARAASARQQSLNNLRQIGLAMHNYYDTYKSLPPPCNFGKNGKRLLSWRVHILPYIEQQQLYQQFKLNEPWDSPHNKKLIPLMPEVLRSPKSKAAPGETTYLAPILKNSLFGSAKGRQFKDVIDGTSNTIAVLEVNDDHAVTWTKPDDLAVDVQNPLKGLTGQEAGVFAALFLDGSVRSISTEIAPADFIGYITINGREIAPAN